MTEISVELRERVLLIGLNRPQKRNAFTLAMLQELAAAYGRLERDDDAWVGVLHAHGNHFTSGLDLGELGPKLAAGEADYIGNGVDPWDIVGTARTKPLVAAVQGKCYTAGVELTLAADIRVAASDASFAQMEVQRGLFPWGGATLRLVQNAGWGNAMRWILTGDEFGAEEALRIGLVQEVVGPELLLDRALEIAQRVAAQAPLGVRAARRSARKALTDPQAAQAELMGEVRALFATEDMQEGIASFLERRPAYFRGR